MTHRQILIPESVYCFLSKLLELHAVQNIGMAQDEDAFIASYQLFHKKKVNKQCQHN
jgi:hypothetical protein